MGFGHLQDRRDARKVSTAKARLDAGTVVAWEWKGGGRGKKPYEGKMIHVAANWVAGLGVSNAAGPGTGQSWKGTGQGGVQEEGLGRCCIVPQDLPSS